MKIIKTLIISSILFIGTNAFSALEKVECTKDEPLRQYDWKCVSCDELGVIYNEDCSTICPNRELIGKDKCILKKCPDNAPLRIDGGSCTTCDNAQDLWLEGDWECAQCPNRKFFEPDRGEHGACILACPNDKPIKVSNKIDNFDCFSCDEPRAIRMEYNSYEEENCQQCPNRKLTEENYCVLKQCPASHPIMDKDGGCRTSNDPRSIEFFDPNARIGFSNDEYQEKQCANYPERKWDMRKCILKQCPASHPMNFNGECYSCDDPETILWAKEEICNLCPNRRIVSTGDKNPTNYCVLSCPSDKPLITVEQERRECHSCDDEKQLYTNDCHLCSNREQIGTKCNLKCSGENPLQSEDGDCLSCQTERVRITSKEKCDVCPDNIFFSRDDQDFCMHCPKDKPLISEKYADCHTCDDVKAIKLVENQKASNVCPELRKTINGYSVLKQCPNNAPLVDNKGQCWSCDEERNAINVKGVEKNCSICPNRVVKYGYCIIPKENSPIVGIGDYGNFDWIEQYPCDAKGQYDVGVRKIAVAGTEESCLLCPNRKILKEKYGDEVIPYCVGK